jgi:chromosome segregation protein
LEQAENALSGYAGGVQLLLKAARQARLKGARGALSSFLEVPAEYEIAIAAALGEFVDAVVLEDGSLEAALGLLDGQTARAAILPTDALTPGSIYNPLEGSDPLEILGSAAKLVRAP